MASGGLWVGGKGWWRQWPGWDSNSALHCRMCIGGKNLVLRLISYAQRARERRQTCFFPSNSTSHANYVSVASLGWVTPGAATEGVTPLFFSWKNWRPFWSSPSLPVLRCHPFIFCWKNNDLFAHRCHFLLILLGCHPPGGCHPAPFLPARLVSPLFFVNLPTNFFPSGVTRGGPFPPSDASDYSHWMCNIISAQWCVTLYWYEHWFYRL